MPAQSPPQAGRAGVPDGGWGRGRLLGILAGVAAAAVLLAGGVASAVHLALAGIDEDTPGRPGFSVGASEDPSRVRGVGWRDEVAAAPMLSVPAAAAWPTQTTGSGGGSIVVPAGTGDLGPAYVRAGFPHTPEGAIAQLAQIDIAALSSLSTVTAGEVHRAWVLPGGVDAQTWWPVVSMRAFLDGTGTATQAGAAAAGPTLSLTPVAALVKGTDGPDWAVVCVLFEVTGSFRSQAQMAAGDCARMQWVGGRWMIAPGPAPTPAPATWPGTTWAVQAGWRTWSTAPNGEDGQP